MSKWRFDKKGTWVYPSIRVTATYGDVIDASYRIDDSWSAVDAATPATIPPPNPVVAPYAETPEGAFLVYSKEANNFVPSTVAPFDANGRVVEAGLPDRLSEANLTSTFGNQGDAAIQAVKGQPDGLATLDANGDVVELPSRLSQAALDAAYLAADTGALETDLSALSSRVDGLDANQTALMETAASVEELCLSVSAQAAVIAGALEVDTQAAHNLSLFTAPFSCKILSIAFVADRTPSAPSDATNYLSAVVYKRSADGATNTELVRKYTRPSDGEEWLLRVPWNFDMLTWDESARVLNVNEMLYVTLDGNGTSLIRYPMNVVVRYQPL